MSTPYKTADDHIAPTPTGDITSGMQPSCVGAVIGNDSAATSPLPGQAIGDAAIDPDYYEAV